MDPLAPRPGEPPRTIGGFLRFLLERIVLRRRWLLLPLWILLALAAALLIVTGNSYLLPAIYIGF